MKLIHEIHHRSRPQKRSKVANPPKQNIGHSIGGVARYAWSEFDIEHTRNRGPAHLPRAANNDLKNWFRT